MLDSPGPGLLVVEVDRPAPAAVTVEVLGEIDLSTASALQERLESLLDTGIQDMILELRGVAFCDVPGLNVLLRVQTQLGSRGGHLSVVGASRTLRVVVTVLGLTECLHLVPAPGAEFR